MDVQKLTMDQTQARDLYHAYKASRAPLTANDQAIAAIYKRIAQGKLVIRALASITAAGLNAQGLPKLAISRADMPKVQCFTARDAVTFNGADSRGSEASEAHGTVLAANTRDPNEMGQALYAGRLPRALAAHDT